MEKKVCVIDGHPDPGEERYIHALCKAYSQGARSGGHRVETINVAEIAPQPLQTIEAFSQPPSPIYREQQEKIEWADHVMLAFPLWLGSMPAATRALFEQIACGNFFLQTGGSETNWPRKMMKGKSARVIVTMGMPALVYRTLMGGASLKALERGMLGISGFKRVRHTIIGGVESSDKKRLKWLSEVADLGRSAI